MLEGQHYGNRTPKAHELRVIERVAQGLKNSEIAEALGTTSHVIKNYLGAIYDKLGLWNLRFRFLSWIGKLPRRCLLRTSLFANDRASQPAFPESTP